MNYDCSQCPITLESFCEKRPGRFPLGMPFRFGEYVYATDNIIAVRVQADSYDGNASMGKKFPDITALGWDGTVTEWTTIPEPQHCDHCNDRRTVFYEQGEEKENCDLLVPCPECEVLIHGKRVVWEYVAALIRFGANLTCGITKDQRNPYSPVHFQFDGGHALLMPLEQVGDKTIKSGG